MATVIWQTKNSFNTKFIIFKETVRMQRGQRVFADNIYAYAVLPDIYRMVQGSGIQRQQLIVTPDQASSAKSWVMSHYLNEHGSSVASVALNALAQTNLPLASGDLGGPTEMFTSIYAEFPDSWVTQSGYPNRSPADVVSPDFPDNPRFLIGWSGNTTAKVTVVPITGAILGTRFPTNWTTLSSTAAVTDLESVRII